MTRAELILIRRRLEAASSGGGGPALPATFWQALALALADVPEIGTLTGFYFQQVKPGFSYPYLITSPINDAATMIGSTPGYADQSDVQFTIAAADDYQAEWLGAACRRAFRRDAPHPIPQLVADDGAEAGRWPGFVRRSAPPGRGPGNVLVYTYQFGYTFLINR